MDNINNIQYFVKESQFEQALVDLLPHHGWEKEVIVQPTEEDLIQNWAKILFDNNRDINKLGNYPLTASEMRQIIDQVNLCDSPYAMNMFINGGQVCIKRDNSADTNNYGKEVYLKIFDAREISAGQSRYQIAQQPVFKARSAVLPNRRGDFMLLINGMPLIHCELKRSGVDVSQAYNQIEKYGLTSMSLGLNVTNPFTFCSSKLDGQDPEISATGTTAMPITQTYTISLNLSF